MQAEPQFEAKATDKFLDLLLDALPLIAFWKNILVAESIRYGKVKATKMSDKSRGFDPKLFTVANFLRLLACVILKGLIKAKDDPTLFRTERRPGYVRTGAEEITGLTLWQYQQLLRFMHLVDNRKKKRAHEADFDKCFLVRPLIEHLQRAFYRWFFPGTDNAVDEAGLPSRSHWLRSYNKTKPHKYFIEILMAACSKTKFIWDFFVTESAKKVIKRANRVRGQSRFKKTAHFQHEFDGYDREVQRSYGVTCAQMCYFARKLRAYDPPDVDTGECESLYRLYTDRRWDNILGIVLCKNLYGVSYTATVKAGHRYHVDWQFKATKKRPGLVKSKDASVRGKYRCATTTIDGVKLNTVLWVDSSLVACISADLGTESHDVDRRRGRHVKPITCPRMIFVRGKFFRAVDVSDQLRLGKVHFVVVTKKKVWVKLAFGLVEICLVNMYIVVINTNPDYVKLTQEDFRWQLVTELVTKVKKLDARAARAARARADAAPDDGVVSATGVPAEYEHKTPLQIRLEGRDGSHHHEIQSEYVSVSEARANQKVVDDEPAHRATKRKRCRLRDHQRMDGKVLNPFHVSLGSCIVCKFFFKKKKPTRTARYCRECMTDPKWPETTRAKGWQRRFQPRLCSKKCFDIFHTSRISGLDFRQVRRKSAGRPRTPRSNTRTTTPRSTPSTPNTNPWTTNRRTRTNEEVQV